MTVTVTYPGVYVEEDSSTSLSVISSPTAVPIFIAVDMYDDQGHLFPSYECIRINNYLEFVNLSIIHWTNVSVSILSGDGSSGDPYTVSISYVPVNGTHCFLQLRNYFANGGGYCYVLPVSGDDLAEPEIAGSRLVSEIQKYSDVTLISVVALNTERSAVVYPLLTPLLVSGSLYFMITDADEEGQPTSAAPAYSAAYYPTIEIRADGTRPPDTAITVVSRDDNGDNTVTTLAEMGGDNEVAYWDISNQIDRDFLTLSFPMPASSTMAGVYCATDRQRGVWSAPANVAIEGILGISAPVSNAVAGALNDTGVNVFRYVNKRGYIVAGARTVDGTATNTDLSWRYIQVRRLFNSAESDIKRAMRTLVFEPNNAPTWEKARSAIDNYLYALWQEGALVGAKHEDAYFVQIGKDVTMTDDDIAAGKMIATVGMAAVRPAEFIILQFTQDMMGS
ncbi:phage tail sheath family protein [Pararobbsia silviterrae]|uniref:Phage tail sheath family protein n=1 Tax=Pararobbsia silviterrae TaxID=1792498 RepID=A0A494XZN1_9BURK|nr:phage tail sheath C-terminal domain-containing protein [Pararobbsia silviterrae]RKP55965.1 phage tail sheath family protein [Pararobbsia silviterrae]